MQEEIPQPQTPETPPPAPRRRMSRGLIVALSGVVLGLLMLCFVGAMLICQTFEGGCSLPSGIVASNEPTPTPIVPQAQPTVASGIISVGSGDSAVQLQVDPPTSLSAGGDDFAVQVGGVGTDGRWNPIVGSDKVAVWLNGTVINYVMAVQDTEANRTLMESLELGELIEMQTAQGRTLEFDFSERDVVPITKLDIFSQTSPGITVVLVRNDEAQDRMIVRGRYKVAEAAPSIPTGGGSFDGGRVAELGEVVQLGDLQLMVSAFDMRAASDPSFSYFLVDYQIQNNGAVPIEAGALEFTLVDSIGSTYPLSIDASQFGNFRPIPQSLGVAQPLQATAGYQIPSGLVPTSLGWIVRRIDTGEQVEIRTARAAANEPVAISADITLDSASLVAQATSLQLNGAIANRGTTPLVIQQSDVSMSSSGTVYLIQATNPPFPWTIPPGEAMSYSLTVQKPFDGSVATFAILDSSWQLDNFR